MPPTLFQNISVNNNSAFYGNDIGFFCKINKLILGGYPIRLQQKYIKESLISKYLQTAGTYEDLSPRRLLSSGNSNKSFEQKLNDTNLV